MVATSGSMQQQKKAKSSLLEPHRRRVYGMYGVPVHHLLMSIIKA
jgi:hypothetical protein